MTCGVVLLPKQIRVRDHVFLLECVFMCVCCVGHGLSCVVVLLCTGGYAFMGSLIIQEVVKDLLTKGLDNAKVLLLAGSR